MKEVKDENHVNNKTCQTGSCGCSVKHIVLGIVVFFCVIFAAVIFGN